MECRKGIIAWTGSKQKHYTCIADSAEYFLLINVMSVKDVFKFTGQYQKDAKQALENAGIVIKENTVHSRPLGRISYIEADPDRYKKAVERLTGNL